MCVQRSGDNRRTSDAGSYLQASEHFTKDKCIFIYGISKRKVCIDDIR